MTEIALTQHAQDKFEIFKRYGFEETLEQVIETVSHPDSVIAQAGGRLIAQKVITAQHVLRVIYREQSNQRIVITFYPGRKDRYETKV